MVKYRMGYEMVSDFVPYSGTFVNVVKLFVNWGILERPVVCEGCNREFDYVPFKLIYDGVFYFPISAHHYCYSDGYMLDVIWFCPSCHMKVHRWLFLETIKPVRDLLKSEGYRLNRLGFVSKLFWFSSFGYVGYKN